MSPERLNLKVFKAFKALAGCRQGKNFKALGESLEKPQRQRPRPKWACATTAAGGKVNSEQKRNIKVGATSRFALHCPSPMRLYKDTLCKVCCFGLRNLEEALPPPCAHLCPTSSDWVMVEDRAVLYRFVVANL